MTVGGGDEVIIICPASICGLISLLLISTFSYV